jgi:hypothetical protein
MRGEDDLVKMNCDLGIAPTFCSSERKRWSNENELRLKDLHPHFVVLREKDDLVKMN